MLAPRQLIPIQVCSLKGLPGIPSPICIFHVSSFSKGPESEKKYQESSQQERTFERRIQKTIRRLLLKAGIPSVSRVGSSKSTEGMMFQVYIVISMLRENLISYSVRMQLIEEVLLARDANIKIEAVTWGGEPVTGYSYRREQNDDYAIEEIVEYIIQEHIAAKVRRLAASFWNDNEPKFEGKELDRKYDTGPLSES